MVSLNKTIMRFFFFFSLPPGSLLVVGLSEKQLGMALVKLTVFVSLPWLLQQLFVVFFHT